MNALGRTGLRLLLALPIALAFLSPEDAPAEPIRAAVFDFELIDTSLQGAMQGPQPEERRRLERLGERLRRELAASDRYVLVDAAPARDEIRAAGRLHSCNECAARIGRSLGAEVAITGTVQKVSNLILNINLYVWDTAAGDLRRAMSVDIRGNTDESWSRGLSYLLRHRLLKEPRSEGRIGRAAARRKTPWRRRRRGVAIRRNGDLAFRTAAVRTGKEEGSA